jgi:hypothetical protein
VEERSSKRPQPSGDWKPYEREQKQPARSASSDWKPYEREKEQETRSASSDWKPYKREKEQRSRDADTESGAGEKQSRPDRESSSQNGDEAEAGKRSETAGRDSEQRSDSERRDSDDQEPVDAMGKEKHRQVIGKRYGASRSRQLLYYGAFVAFVIAAYIGLKAAADSMDKAPAHDPDQAPWSKQNAPGTPLGGFEPTSPNQKGAADFQ